MIALVGLAGGAGAMSRFALDGWLQQRFPRSPSVGTTLINVSGCLLLGMLTGWALRHGGAGDVLAVLGTGFLGGYTTFSTASVEAAALTLQGRGRRALFHAARMLVLAWLAAALGLWLTSP